MARNGRGLYLVTALAGQYGQFANHVLSAQINTRIGLAISHLLSLANGLAERDLFRERVEYEVECAAQHRLNAQNIVARTAQVADGMDDRQARAYVCLKQKLHAALASDVFQVGVVGIVRCCGHLVSRHHCHVVVQ